MHSGSQRGSAADTIEGSSCSLSPITLPSYVLKKMLFLQALPQSSPGGNHGNRLDRRPPSTYHFLGKLSPHWLLPEWSTFPILLQGHHTGLYPKNSNTFWIYGMEYFTFPVCWYSDKTDCLFCFFSSPLKANISNRWSSRLCIFCLCIFSQPNPPTADTHPLRFSVYVTVSPVILTERKRHRRRKCRSTGRCERERATKSISDGAADCQPPPEWLPWITSLQLQCFYWITLPCYWTWTLPINTNNEAAEHVKKKKKEK